MKDMSNIVYWYKNQVVITYHSQIPVNALRDDVLHTISRHEKDIHDQLTPYRLRRIGQNAMAGQSTDVALASGDSTDLDGIYLFPTPTGRLINQSEALIAVFYTIEVDPQKS